MLLVMLQVGLRKCEGWAVGSALYACVYPANANLACCPLPQTWVAGSLLFTTGGLFLAWRHFVMQVV